MANRHPPNESGVPESASKEAPPEKLSPDAKSDPAPHTLSLGEFCRRESARFNRPETVGAFFKLETIAGHLRDTEEQFAKRLSDFLTQPAN